MAGGAALSAALTDLAALPARAYERDVASAEVLALRHMLDRKSRRTKEEEAFLMSTQDILDEFRAEEAARAVLAVLRARGVGVPEGVRDRILAEKELAALDRWLEKAATASTIAQVIDTPS